MKLNPAVSRWAGLARDTVFPPRILVDGEEEAAEAEALALWQGLFMPFGPLVDDADILELGSGDGRMARRLVTHGQARSVTGVEPGEDPGEWREELEGRLRLGDSVALLDALDEGLFDLILARDFEAATPLSVLERRARRLYDLLRPGGEALLRLGCAPPRPVAGEGPGYGVMTPSAWAMVMMRAGFEIADLRRIWRGDRDQAEAARALPSTEDEERLAAEVRIHLIRPWESWELEAAAAAPKTGRRR